MQFFLVSLWLAAVLARRQLIDLLTSPAEVNGKGSAAVTRFISEEEENGMHVKLLTEVYISGLEENGNVLVVFDLPEGCFADVDELSKRHSFNWTQGVRVHSVSSSSNPELFAEEAQPEPIGIEFLDVPLSRGPLTLSFSLPVHLRYHAARADSSASHALVRISPPRVYESSSAALASFSSTQLVISASLPHQPLGPLSTPLPAACKPVLLRVPLGHLEAAGRVRAWLIATLSCSSALVLASLFL
jgi:hypothetical protein